MKITKNDIISYSQEHSPLGGKRTTLETEDLLISIVGGRNGLYGDFVNDFELAIFELETKSFVTRNYIQELNDDVAGYLNGDELLEIINPLLEKGFRVI